MKPSLRAALPWAIIVLVAAGAAWLRYGFIEPSDMAHACDSADGPWWCATRTLVVEGFLSYGYGYAAVLMALVALFWLYCYEGGALALLIGALRLVRVQYDRQQVTAEA
jgi:hypothetical protein